MIVTNNHKSSKENYRLNSHILLREKDKSELEKVLKRDNYEVPRDISKEIIIIENDQVKNQKYKLLIRVELVIYCFNLLCDLSEK